MGGYISLPCGQKSKLSKPSVSVLVGIVEISASLRARSLNFYVSVLIRAHPWDINSHWSHWYTLIFRVSVQIRARQWLVSSPAGKTSFCGFSFDHWTARNFTEPGGGIYINNFNRIWFTTTQTTLFNNNSVGEQHTPTAGIVFIVDSSLLVLLKYILPWALAVLLRAAGSPMSLVGEWGALQELLDLCCCCYHVPFLVGIV